MAAVRMVIFVSAFFVLLGVLSVQGQAPPYSYYLTSPGVEEIYEEFNTSSFNGNNYITQNVSYYAPSAALYAPNINLANYVAFDEDVTSAGMAIDILDVYNSSNTPFTGEPKLYVEQRIQQFDTSVNPDKVKISMWIYNTVTATVAYGVSVSFDLTGGLAADLGSFSINTTYNAEITAVNNKQFTWNPTDITGLQGRHVEFEATPTGSVGRDLAVGTNLFTSSLTYFLDNTLTAAVKVGPVDLTVCVSRQDTVTNGVLYEHGLTALTFFMALLLGIIIVIVCVVLYRIFTNRRGGRGRNRVHEHDVIIHEKGNRLVMDYGKSLSKTGHTITDYSLVKEDDSIVSILAMKDRLGRHREIDNLDIAATIAVDEGIEDQRNESSEAVTTMYVQIMKQNGDITQGAEDQVLNKHKMRKGVLRKHLDDEYQNEKRKLLKKLSAKNKVSFLLRTR